jgi:glyoxylase-like metal-dependent hydrolase (beta-lactamase superfamily II)
VESAKKFSEKSNALVAINKDDEPIYKMFGGDKIDRCLEEGELKIDSLVQDKLEVFLTPGHSPGHISLYWPSKKALAVGDVISIAVQAGSIYRR